MTAPIPDIDLNFLARQLASLTAEIRSLRDETRALRAIREDISLLRDELRITTNMVRRLDDTITMNVLDRLQALEQERGTSS